jgi:hypothetical protein
MSHFIEQEYQLAITYHQSNYGMSHFIEQEYQLTITYHQANYRHVTLKNTGKLQIFQNLLNRNINDQ